MKKFLATVVLALSAAAFAQTDASSTSQGGTQSGATGGAQQKTIKDAAEYNAYISATGQTDPASKAAALEAFVQQYPNSVVKEDALEGAMAAYQQAGNMAKVNDAANRVLQINPNNVLALFVQVYAKGLAAQQNPASAQQNQGEAAQLAQRGLSALSSRTKPEGMSQADFDKQQKLFTAVFNGAIGANALNQKDYATAQKTFTEAVKQNPADVQSIYQLAISYLSVPKQQRTDEQSLSGLWFIARATALAPQVAQISDFGRKSYKAFHGSEEGWDQLVAQAKSEPFPPQGFTIQKYIPPSPADQAAQMLRENPNVLQWDTGFGGWIFVLGSGNQQAAETVWNAIQGKPLKFLAKVLEGSTAEQVVAAVTSDGFDANHPEVTIAMETPVKTLQIGSQIQVQAVPTSYTPNPLMLQMNNGIDLTAKTPAAKAKPKAAVKKKAPVKKRTTRR
jgi:tetratricopeptide (TPR) repeat protein